MIFFGETVPHILFVAIYARGAPRAWSPPVRRWPALEATLRRETPHLGEAAAVLRANGFPEEALLLHDAALLRWAEARADQILTPFCRAYPHDWVRRLGAMAPPAVWWRGDLTVAHGVPVPHHQGPQRPVRWVGAVGSRHLDTPSSKFAQEVGAEVARLGHGLVSGGAVGADSLSAEAALRAGGKVMRILPCGLRQSRPVEGACLDVSVCPPHEPFSTGLAMERNLLIYATGEVSVVVHSRLREGGTWHGATSALRRHVGRLAVRADATNPAHTALQRLGAESLPDAAQLGPLLRRPQPAAGLFAAWMVPDEAAIA